MTTTEDFSAEPAGAHTMAAEEGARGDQTPSATGPRADARNIQLYGNAGAGFTAQRRNPDGTWDINREFPTVDDAYKWARGLVDVAATAGHMVEPDEEQAGWRGYRMLCDGTWNSRGGFPTRDDAYTWATEPAPGTVHEGATAVINVDEVQASVLRSLAATARANYEQLIAIANAQNRPHLIYEAGCVLAAMADVEEAL